MFLLISCWPKCSLFYLYFICPAKVWLLWKNGRTDHEESLAVSTITSFKLNKQTIKKLFALGCCCLVAKSLLVTPQTIARQAPLSLGFSRQEYWSGCHFHLQRDPDPGIEPVSLTHPALAVGFSTSEQSNIQRCSILSSRRQ